MKNNSLELKKILSPFSSSPGYSHTQTAGIMVAPALPARGNQPPHLPLSHKLAFWLSVLPSRCPLPSCYLKAFSFLIPSNLCAMHHPSSDYPRCLHLTMLLLTGRANVVKLFLGVSRNWFSGLSSFCIPAISGYCLWKLRIFTPLE